MALLRSRVLPALIAGLGLIPAGRVTAQTFMTLHTFTPLVIFDNGNFTFSFSNDDGATPYGGLITNSSGTTLYGTANGGGSSSGGTVFAVSTNGTGFTTLYSFTRPDLNTGANSDGAYPAAGVILSGNTLYGTAANAGSSGNGTVFSISFRPQPTITPSGTNVVLSWPVSFAGFGYAGYALQDTANLLTPGAWSAYGPFPPTIVNGQLRVTRPMLGPQWSYRLIKL